MKKNIFPSLINLLKMFTAILFIVFLSCCKKEDNQKKMHGWLCIL